MSTQPTTPPDEREEPYLGNIWGWKISLIGLFVIVGLSLLVAYRHWSLDIPFGAPAPAADTTIVDTIDLPYPEQ